LQQSWGQRTPGSPGSPADRRKRVEMLMESPKDKGIANQLVGSLER
jgi:hypothetical protein